MAALGLSFVVGLVLIVMYPGRTRRWLVVIPVVVALGELGRFGAALTERSYH